MLSANGILQTMCAMLVYGNYYDRGNSYGCRATPIGDYQPNLTPLEFLKHVLMNGSDWSLVLDERVKNLGPSPYNDRFEHAIVASADAGPDVELDTRYILTEIVYGYANIKSFVNYAARAVHLSFTCFSMRQMAFQMYYVSRLIDMGVEPGLVLAEVTSVKEIVAVFIDKLAILPAELEMLVESYWELVRLMQYDIVYHIRYAVYPAASKKFVYALHQQYLAYLDRNCTKFVFEKRFFENLGIDVKEEVVDSVLGLNVDQDTLMKLGNDHLSFLNAYYSGLRVKTMSRAMWDQLFYYTKKLPLKDELDETNPIITFHPESDPSVSSVTIAIQ